MPPRPGRPPVLARIAHRRWLGPLTDLARSVTPAYRVAALGAGFRSGFLDEIARAPGSASDLAVRLGVPPEDAGPLEAWLELAVVAGALRRRDGRYRVTHRTRALLRPGNDPVRAFYEEAVDLDLRLVIEGPHRLRSGARFAAADFDQDVIARSSRMGEPWIEVALERALETADPPVRHLVEVGCGTGVHIRTAVALAPDLRVRGLELDPVVAARAQDDLDRWGLGDRVRVETADVREVRGSGDADLVTLHQNVYYFPADTRVTLLRHLGGFLRPGGRLLATTVVRGAGIATAGLDLWGALTDGVERLPTVADLRTALEGAGYRDVEVVGLGPGDMYVAALGTWPGARDAGPSPHPER